jgi:hypothetical protein
MIPRRYRWDVEKWDYYTDNNGRAEFVDYETYLYPFLQPYRPRLTCRPDGERAEKNIDKLIDEDMGFQGSAWFMHKEHFDKRLNGMSTHGYGTFAEEPQEIGLKTQLGPWGGAILRNKKTWYAHYAKPASHWNAPAEIAGRADDKERENGYLYSWDYWWHNRWEQQVETFQDLVDQFWPLRTWPDDWRWLSNQYNRYKLSDLWHTQPQR